MPRGSRIYGGGRIEPDSRKSQHDDMPRAVADDIPRLRRRRHLKEDAMEHSKPLAKPVDKVSPELAKKKEACIEQFMHAFANNHFSNGQPLSLHDQCLHTLLLLNLHQSGKSSVLDLSNDERDYVEFAHPEMLEKFAAACKQIGYTVTSLKLPIAMLSVPDAWVTHLTEVVEVDFSSHYMGRTMELQKWSKLKKVNIGYPVNLKLLAVPTGCKLVADADFPVAFDKKFEVKDPSAPTVERGFLSVMEQDGFGTLSNARKYRMTQPYWQASFNDFDKWKLNLNGKAVTAGEYALECKHLAALWLNNRSAYRAAKDAAEKSGKHLIAETANDPKKIRFDYEDFSSIEKLLAANQRHSLYVEWECIIARAPSHHYIRSSEWPKYVHDQFSLLMHETENAVSSFAFSTFNHAMGVEFLVRAQPNNKPLFILTFFDPNINVHKRLLAHDLSEVSNWRLSDLSSDLDENGFYHPAGVHNPSVFLAEYISIQKDGKINLFKDKLASCTVKFWPTNPEPIDEVCHLELSYTHGDLWKNLVSKALASFSEHEKIIFLAVPSDHEGYLRSCFCQRLQIEKTTRNSFIQLLDSMHYALTQIINYLITLQGCGSFNVKCVNKDDFRLLVDTILEYRSALNGKAPAPGEIVKILSSRPSSEGGISTMLRALVFVDIGSWLKQLVRLLNEKLISVSELKQIINSHQPAVKGAWLYALEYEYRKNRYTRVRKFAMHLQDGGLTLSSDGNVVDKSPGELGSSTLFRKLVKLWTPDAHKAIQMLALSICGELESRPEVALYSVFRFRSSGVAEMFNLIVELSLETKDRWEFVAAELCSLQISSAQGPLYLFNELMIDKQRSFLSSLGVSLCRENIVEELTRLVAAGMPEKVLIRICSALIDPVTPSSSKFIFNILGRLNLKWAEGVITPIAKNPVAIAPH